METTEVQKEKKPKAVDSYERYQLALGKAQHHKLPYIEVTKEFFQTLTDDPNTTYLTVGKPGIKVYIEGTREEIEGIERMSAEDHRTWEIKQKQIKAGVVR